MEQIFALLSQLASYIVPPNYRGNYSGATTYAKNDSVLSAEGNHYISMENDNVGNTPPADGSSNSHWGCIGKAGATGQPGLDGSNLSVGVYTQLLINGGFEVNQQAVSPYTSTTTPANNDDTYAAPDQWNLLSDGNNIVNIYRETTIVPAGAAACCKLEWVTANKKAGIAQYIENKDAIKYRGKYASVQFKLRTDTGHIVRNARAMLLAWTGTADSLTSDVVASTWPAEGSNPTLAANWTALNTPANLVLVADTFTLFQIQNISIPANANNLALFIWADDGDAAVGDLLYIADVQWNQGATCLPYMPRSYSDEVLRCERYLLVVNSAGGAYGFAGTAVSDTATRGYLVQRLSVPFRIVNAPVTKIGNWQYSNASPVTVTGITSENTLDTLSLNVACAGATVGHSGIVTANNDATARIIIDGRL